LALKFSFYVFRRVSNFSNITVFNQLIDILGFLSKNLGLEVLQQFADKQKNIATKLMLHLKCSTKNVA